MSTRASTTLSTPVEQCIDAAFALFKNYGGLWRKNNIEYLNALLARKPSLTQFEELKALLKELSAVKFSDNYGKSVYLEDIVAFDLTQKQQTLPPELRCNRKKPPTYQAKFPKHSYGVRSVHLFEVLKDLYQTLLPLYESTKTIDYTETQLKTSLSFTQVQSFVNQNRKTFNGKHDLARDVQICGMKHLGEETDSAAMSLSDTEAQQRVYHQLLATNPHGDDTHLNALADFIIHHGGADLGTATAICELNNTVTAHDGTKLQVGTAKANPFNPNAMHYQWENGKLVGEFDIHCYSFKDNQHIPPVFYAYDPNQQAFVCFDDIDANEAILNTLQSNSKNDFKTSQPSATIRLKVHLNVDARGHVRPVVTSCETKVNNNHVQQRAQKAANFDYSALTQVHHENLADFIVHHGHQDGLMKSLERLLEAHLYRPGENEFSVLNPTTEIMDFSVNATGQLVATMKIHVYNFVEDGQPLHYYAFDPLQNRYCHFSEDELTLEKATLIEKPTNEAKTWLNPLASAYAQVVITPQGESVDVRWQTVNVQMHHPDLVERMQRLVDDAALLLKHEHLTPAHAIARSA